VLFPEETPYNLIMQIKPDVLVKGSDYRVDQVVGKEEVEAFGGKVVRAPEPVHGKVASIKHASKGVFNALPLPLKATRYHSLVVERSSLPDCLEVTAETDDGLIMGLAHKTYPIQGVQFHPESIASESGHELLKNFLNLAADKAA